MFLLSSCKKESAGHPHLLGSWRSTTNNLTLTFRDGRFEASHDIPSNPKYLVQKGSYTLDGRSIYITVEQAEGFDPLNIPVHLKVVYQNPVVEHYKFKIIGESVEMTRVNGVFITSLMIPNGIYAKRY